MSQADFFNTARVRVNGKCEIVDLRSEPEPVSGEQPKPMPFPAMPVCEFTSQPYTAWCEVHKRYHRDGVGGATEQKTGLRMAGAPSLMAVAVHRLLFARFRSRWSVERCRLN
jgi:hypothetical protein